MITKKTQQVGRTQRWFTIYNTSGEIIPAHAAVEVVSVEADGVIRVKKPSADSLAHALITGRSTTGIGDYGVATNQFGTYAYYDTAGGDPATGDYLGTVAGSWKLELAKRGFLAWGGADAETGLVHVQREMNCAGATGSGSGSGGSGGGGCNCCCGCDRFKAGSVYEGFPATMDATITCSCIGTRTVTLSQQALWGAFDVEGCGTTGSAVKALYTGSFLGTADEYFTSYEDCTSGSTVGNSPTHDEFLEVSLACLTCANTDPVNDQSGDWWLWVWWGKIIAGEWFEVTMLTKVVINTCSPFSVSSNTKTILCNDDASLSTCDNPTVGGEANWCCTCDSPTYYDFATSLQTGCEGGTIQGDVDE